MKTIIEWFVDNSIASTLLMIVFLVGGVFGAQKIKREVFPVPDSNIIEVEIIYSGASPSEIESLISLRIEEALSGVVNIKKITSIASEGLSRTVIELKNNSSKSILLNEIKARVDAIEGMPVDAESAIVRLVEGQSDLVFFSIAGNVNDDRLREVARGLMTDLRNISGVARVTSSGVKNKEISIEVSEAALLTHNLSFDDIVGAIRGSSVDIAAGSVKSSDFEYQIQAKAQADRSSEFASIPILSLENGGTLILDDIANVVEITEDTLGDVRVNSIPGVIFQVYADRNFDSVETNSRVREYLINQKHRLNPDLDLDITFEMVSIFTDRTNLLIKNAIGGLLLVFIVLFLFLNTKQAFWVSVGICVTYMGVLFSLSYLNVSLSMISLFGFLLILGIIVDDAIIVGEKIHSETLNSENRSKLNSLKNGVLSVKSPVLLAITTTTIFFIPLFLVPDSFRFLTYPLAVVIVLCLLFSAIECFLILPSHLASSHGDRIFNKIDRISVPIRGYSSRFLNKLNHDLYGGLLSVSLKKKGTLLAIFFAIFLVFIGIVNGGWLRGSFAPVVPNDAININVVMPPGTSEAKLTKLHNHLVNSVERIKSEQSLLKENRNRTFIKKYESEITSDRVRVFVALEPADKRNIDPKKIVERYQQIVGSIPSALEYKVDHSINGISSEINLVLSIDSDEYADQREVASEIVKALSQYPNVFNIRNGSVGSRDEIRINLKPEARSYGFNLSEVMRQVRTGYFGQEAQRIIRDKENIKVMVRFPSEFRAYLSNLKELRVRTDDGVFIPLVNIADVSVVPGFNNITRISQKRAIEIKADVKPGANVGLIYDDFFSKNYDLWKSRYSGFSLTVGQDKIEEQNFIDSLIQNFVFAVFLVFCLIAIIFRSYILPFVVLLAIPFGFVGAVFGHLILGLEFSMMSMLGLVACAGVVVNDNLVLLDTIHKAMKEDGKHIEEIISECAKSRFRPVVLTSLTTFVGLMPLILETSVQAQFLIPMVVSLGFGVMFSTFVTLLLVPCLASFYWNMKSRQKSVDLLNHYS